MARRLLFRPLFISILALAGVEDCLCAQKRHIVKREQIYVLYNLSFLFIFFYCNLLIHTMASFVEKSGVLFE